MRERTRRDSDSAGRQAGGRGVLRGKGPDAVCAGRVPGECAVALRGVRVKRVRRTPESCCGLPHRGGKRVRWGRGLRFALALPPALLRPRRRGQGRVTGPAVCERLGLGQLGGGAGLLTSERVLCCSLADFRVTTICLPTLLTSCVRDNGSMMMAPPGERTQASRKRAREREGVRGGQSEATGTCWRRGKGQYAPGRVEKSLPRGGVLSARKSTISP